MQSGGPWVNLRFRVAQSMRKFVTCKLSVSTIESRLANFYWISCYLSSWYDYYFDVCRNMEAENAIEPGTGHFIRRPEELLSRTWYLHAD